MTILIPIVSEFNNKGFKQAEKQVSVLDKGLKRLAVTLGASLSVRKITQFSKASIKAFLEEDKAVQALARNLENLGLAYDVRPIEAYIRELQYATGVADGELRPALQQLITTTKNLGTAQELLALSLDISAGTGRSLASVTQALGRAYLGTNTSLTRLNIGLSKADLSTKSFSEITEQLTKQFSGQAQKAAGTYAGQLAILSAAAGDAQEILGEKLVKSIALLVDPEKGVPALADSFESMATNVGNAVLGLTTLIEKVKTLGGILPGNRGLTLDGLNPNIPGIQGFNILTRLGGNRSAKDQAKADALANANAKEQGMLRSRALRIETKITGEKKKQNKETKDANKLEKASKVFDDELITLEAALKNAELSENEVIRLRLKKALLLENADAAERLTKKLFESNAELLKLAQFKPANPFQSWLDAIDELNKRIAALGRVTAPTVEQGEAARQVIGLGESTGNTAIVDQGLNMLSSWLTGGEDAALKEYLESERAALEADMNAAQVRQMATTVNVYVEGVGGLNDQAKKEVVDAVVEASAQGYGTGWFRTEGVYAI
jgi:hypothetical protein